MTYQPFNPFRGFPVVRRRRIGANNPQIVQGPSLAYSADLFTRRSDFSGINGFARCHSPERHRRLLSLFQHLPHHFHPHFDLYVISIIHDPPPQHLRVPTSPPQILLPAVTVLFFLSKRAKIIFRSWLILYT